MGRPASPSGPWSRWRCPTLDEEKAIHVALKLYAAMRSERARDNAESMATDFVLKTLKEASVLPALRPLPEHADQAQNTITFVMP